MGQAATIETRLPTEPVASTQPAEIEASQTALGPFVKAHRLKGFRDDECGDSEIVGRFGHLFEWSPSVLGVVLEDAGTESLERRKREGVRAGLTLALECDFGECILHFDPQNGEQARTAINIAGIRRRKRVSTSQAEALRRYGHPFPSAKQVI